VDRALGRLAGASLVAFSVDGMVASAHRLVMRVIRPAKIGRGRGSRRRFFDAA
jgi:hypothetical protein